MNLDSLCSWCGMPAREVQMVAGPHACICRVCHGLVGDIFGPATESTAPANHPDLTDRQRAVLDHIRSKITEQGYAPTLREIGEALGMKSTNGVQDHVKALEKKGYIRRTYGTARSIVLTEQTDVRPQCGADRLFIAGEEPWGEP